MPMLPGRLRVQFIVAAGLLVLTTVAAGVWAYVALSRLSGLVTDTIQQSEAVSAVTARLSGALEREDDAVLLVLAGEVEAARTLGRERDVVDEAMRELSRILEPRDVRGFVDPLAAELAAYRQAADRVVAEAGARDALVRYHDEANPLLRRTVTRATAIRERHFALAQAAVVRAGDQAAAARRVVLLVTLAALVIAAAVAVHLTRRVVGPLRRLTEGAHALRRGEFATRIDVPSRDELGDLAAVFNEMARDLQEFRQTNVREVVRAKNTLEATLEALPDAVVLFDADGRIQAMNGAARTALSSAAIDEPRAIADLRLPGLDVQALTATLGGAIPVPPVDLAQAITLHHDGRTRRLLPRLVAVPELDPSGRGAILLLYDVTDLARLDEMRSELVAVASHELQTPLTTLRMTLLMLNESSAALPARGQELVATALIGVQQLAETVDEFLDLTRIEAGQLRLNLEPLPLVGLLKDTVARVEPQARALGLSVRLDDLPTAVRVHADPRRLRAVFDNVLSNALKFTPRGGHITIVGRTVESAGVEVRITDSGPGVPPAYRQRIFDKFFRLDGQEEAGIGARGAGIGLYLSRQIVERHGGTIHCQDGPDGRGASLVVRLPLTEPDA